MKPGRGITKANGRKNALDKFYTKQDVAQRLIAFVDPESYTQVIEPSAGAGAFSKQIRFCLAFDLEPEDASIVQQDWFEYAQVRNVNERVLVIGNPPFGQKHSLAVKFVNHSAGFADTIAFILPKSFMKESVQKTLNPFLHLRLNMVLEKNIFLLDGVDMNVPSVFQVWDFVEGVKREHLGVPTYKGFRFVKKTEEPDIFVQRIGGKAGVAGLDFLGRNESSNYFLKVDSSVIEPDVLVNKINSVVFSSRDLSVGPRSLSKKEFVVDLLKVAPFLENSD